jgi:hypothetical protein
MARSKGKAKPPKEAVPEARARPTLAPARRRMGLIALGTGAALVLFGIVLGLTTVGATATRGWMYPAMLGPITAGLASIALGMEQLRPAAGEPRGDVRRWIYGGLAAGFAVAYAVCIVYVMPNRLPGAALHLWTVPLFTGLMAAGTLIGNRYGWWLAVIAGSAVLASTILMILRILVSAAFLAGEYGAFGKAAASFALVAVALIVELVALLPICLIKFLMTRVGRRAYGV